MRRQSSANRSSLSRCLITLVGGLSSCRLNRPPSSLNWMLMPLHSKILTNKSIAEKTMAKRAGAIMDPYLMPLVMGKASDEPPHSITLAMMSWWNEWMTVIFFCWQPNLRRSFHKPLCQRPGSGEQTPYTGHCSVHESSLVFVVLQQLCLWCHSQYKSHSVTLFVQSDKYKGTL